MANTGIIEPKTIHEAIQRHHTDAEPYNVARAAISAVLLELHKLYPDCEGVAEQLAIIALVESGQRG